jgi:hypothetical protein
VDIITANLQTGTFWKVLIFFFSNLSLFIFGFWILYAIHEVDEKINELEKDFKEREEKEQDS